MHSGSLNNDSKNPIKLSLHTDECLVESINFMLADQSGITVLAGASNRYFLGSHMKLYIHVVYIFRAMPVRSRPSLFSAFQMLCQSAIGML